MWLGPGQMWLISGQMWRGPGADVAGSRADVARSRRRCGAVPAQMRGWVPGRCGAVPAQMWCGADRLVAPEVADHKMPFFHAERIEDDLSLQATPTKAGAPARLGWAGMARHNMSCYRAGFGFGLAAAMGPHLQRVQLSPNHRLVTAARPGTDMAGSRRRCGWVSAQMWLGPPTDVAGS